MGNACGAGSSSQTGESAITSPQQQAEKDSKNNNNNNKPPLPTAVVVTNNTASNLPGQVSTMPSLPTVDETQVSALPVTEDNNDANDSRLSTVGELPSSQAAALKEAGVNAEQAATLLRLSGGGGRRKKGSNRSSIVVDITKERKQQQLQKLLKKRKQEQNQQEGDAKQNTVVYLPRGGTYVPTNAGPVQFGLPPETIKDSMNMGLDLPTIYVLPKERFNLDLGINVAEFEFPAYFSFFVKRKTVTLVCTPEIEQVIRTIFQETLLGPKEIKWPTQYSEATPKAAYPDLAKELSNFRVNPFDRTELTIDTLLQFVHFNEEKIADIGSGVTIKEEGATYKVLQDGVELAKVQDKVVPAPPELLVKQQIVVNRRASMERMNEDDTPPTANNNNNNNNRDSYSQYGHNEPLAHPLLSTLPFKPRNFVPPVFGVTMLGNSDGFDKSGTTTGFILWMNKRGIMVDPPPHSGMLLKRHGIIARQIGGIILTHCHADHDAGTFQKVLEEGRVTIYATEVIMSSFVRKYSAISGLDSVFLRGCFEWCEILVGHKTPVYGGYLRFNYSLHTIPCVGFEAFCAGKSMVYSADTFNDPTGIQAIFEKKLMTVERRDHLLNFPWQHDVILHEAGVPPIHTPIAMLESLSDDIKERLYIVHKSPSQVPKSLKSALVGPEHTIVITNEAQPSFAAIEVLDLAGSLELFSEFPMSRSIELIQCATRQKLKAGTVVVEEGELADEVYVIVSGFVSVSREAKHIKFLSVGDHFGEISFVFGGNRTATVCTCTDVEILMYRQRDLMYMARDTDTIAKLIRLAQMQQTDSWQVLQKNTMIDSLSSAQKTHIQSILQAATATKGEVLWNAGDVLEGKTMAAVIISQGQMQFERAQDMPPFEVGTLLADMRAITGVNVPISTTLISQTDSTYYWIPLEAWLKFLDQNPGVHLMLMGRRFRE